MCINKWHMAGTQFAALAFLQTSYGVDSCVQTVIDILPGQYGMNTMLLGVLLSWLPFRVIVRWEHMDAQRKRKNVCYARKNTHENARRLHITLRRRVMKIMRSGVKRSYVLHNCHTHAITTFNVDNEVGPSKMLVIFVSTNIQMIFNCVWTEALRTLRRRHRHEVQRL